MKKITIVALLMLVSITTFSCANDTAEDTSLYETQRTEGDNGHVDDGRGDD